MRSIASLVIVVCFPLALSAQTETFDIATYQVPAGWQRQTTEYAVSFSSVDQASGAWCQMAVYSSVPGSNNPANDFSGEWKALVKSDTYSGAVEPLPIASVINGWTRNTGTSKFKWQGKDSRVTVTNFSGYGIMLTVMVSMNSDRYMAESEKFLGSIVLTAPAKNQTPVLETPPSSPPLPATASNGGISITGAAGVSGITLSTTNFDDGWVAQPFADYVRITKQHVTVLLHYSIEINDDMRRAENMALALWDRMITTRYKTSNIRTFQNEMYAYDKVWFAEADAIELSTGKPYHIGLRVLVASGIATPIEIMAPSAADMSKEFPDQSRIANMTSYNKFAVNAKDIIGTWQESTSTGIDMYSTVTGAYAGMNMTASANLFEFKSAEAYFSSHKGAFGMTGSAKFYDQKYNGKLTVTNWDLTMTNRFEGRTDIFWSHYEAVRGGRVLRLTDKAASGINYRLVKTK